MFFPLRRNFHPHSNFPMNSEATFFKDMAVIVYETSKCPAKHIESFPTSLFFKLSTRNIAELLILSSQIHLSDSVENGIVRNKYFPIAHWIYSKYQRSSGQ